MAGDNVSVTGEVQDYHITLYSLGSVLLLADLVASILFILVIIKKSLHKARIFISLLSWAAADLLLGLLLFVQICISHLDWAAVDKPALCTLWNGLQVYPLWVTDLHAVVCAIDRYIIVLCPNKYEVKLSKTRLRLYLGLSWGYGIAWTAIAFSWVGTEKEGQLCNLASLSHIYVFLLVMLHFLPALVACVFLYAKVLIHFRRHERQVHVTHTLTQDELVENTQLARVLLCVTVLYALAWLPFSLVGLARASDPPPGSRWHLALLYTYLIGLIGCLSKLPLFTVFHPDFRAGLKNVLGIRKKPLQVGSSLQD